MKTPCLVDTLGEKCSFFTNSASWRLTLISVFHITHHFSVLNESQTKNFVIKTRLASVTLKQNWKDDDKLLNDMINTYIIMKFSQIFLWNSYINTYWSFSRSQSILWRANRYKQNWRPELENNFSCVIIPKGN